MLLKIAAIAALAACTVDLAPMQTKAGRWRWKVERAGTDGARALLVSGYFTAQKPIGEEHDDDFTTDMSATPAGGVPSHDGAVEIEAGRWLSSGQQRKAFLRIFPGCCATNGNLWQEFMVAGVYLNSGRYDGAADGSSFDGDLFTAEWEGP